MPPPTPTLQHNFIGPIQNHPFHTAVRECIDLTGIGKSTFFCFLEEQQVLMRMIIDLTDSKDYRMATSGYCGIRQVVKDGISYTTMCLSLTKAHAEQETPEQAYDRAMSVIGKR
ncbi:MAG: hypothetical protein KGI25_10420 [Thaumarchaeota archaeon]|nr:hypothetical protein [Nitrososphaerota archaeon]